MDTTAALQETPVFAVKELTYALKMTVETAFSHVCVRGEISGLKRHGSGHTYFCLKDEEEVLNAVCWRGAPKTVPLEDGLEIIATGRLTIYGGRYQLVVETYEPAGQGALLKLLQDRKAKLAAEGLFNAALKKPLPRLPRLIGLITSPTGAVIRDILHRLADRYPCRVLLWPVTVQGTTAAGEVAAAIEGFQSLSERPDVLIVARGGGSLEDLWAFNEENVVRAVATCQIPLISAVGHETDTTLIDFAADIRAPTPTAAAELATPMLHRDLSLFLMTSQQRLAQGLCQRLDWYQVRLQGLSLKRIDPRRLIQEKTQRLDDWTDRFRQAASLSLTRKIQGLEHLTIRLEQGSFKRVLERGFAWATTPQGRTVGAAHQVTLGQDLTLTFHDGSVHVKAVGDKKKTPQPSPQPQLF